MGWLRRSFPPFDLHRQDYVVLDTETTGFHLDKDRVLSVGVVRMRGDVIQLGGAQQWYVRTDGQLGSSPTIHGITHHELADAADEATVWDAFMDFAGDAVLVAHYARFDRGMLGAMAKRAGRAVPEWQWLDTMDVAVALEPSWDQRADALKLDQQLQHYEIQALERHTALGDAYSTALLFQRQLAELAQRGIKSSSALSRPRRGLL